MNAPKHSLLGLNQIKRCTRFTLTDPAAQEVLIAGSFNNWNPTSSPLTNLGHGRWIADLSLPPGRYEYQFVVDGRWIHDRIANELVENPLGGINSVVEVPRTPYHLDPPHRHCEKINPRWRWHYAALLKLRRRLLKATAEQIFDACQCAEPHSMHMADSAADELDHDLAIDELHAEQNLLYEVEQAIQRIIDGTYGKCQATGNPIPAVRLHAIPWTPFCKEVEEELESACAADRRAS